VEDWWLAPDEAKELTSTAFADERAKDMTKVVDCTGFNCQAGDASELLRPQLYSPYYKSCCGKFCVTMSRVGGCESCSPGMGGPAGDHTVMEADGLFSPEKWKVPVGTSRAQLLYDAGVTTRTKTAAMLAGFEVVTSGIVRKSKLNPLSHIQRSHNFKVSSIRIRVENFIGIVKQRFRILGRPLALADLGMMDRIFYTCFMLHNFGNPIVK
jgi:hypothetical protein